MSINISLISNLPPYMNDIPEIIRAYKPYIVIEENCDTCWELNTSIVDDVFSFELKINETIAIYEDYHIIEKDILVYKKLTKRFVKTLLYNYCREITNISLPYGSLTGVRPTKLLYELNATMSNGKEFLKEEFFVSEDRADLIQAVIDNQKGIYNHDSKGVDIFVNIPFCPTRCKYCSFISTEIGKVRKSIPSYIACVKKEIEAIAAKVAENNYTVRSIYVGGGTPTSLEANELSEMLAGLAHYNTEFTVEAGRPDSITQEKLAALSALNVTRISINPQTFKQTTLDALGRSHTVESVYEAYALARQYDFDINMDLICGLQNETYQDFVDSLTATIALKPENITVHTLSIKRGAIYKDEGNEKRVDGLVKQMTDYAIKTLIENNYYPYYMYRQKNMADNLENVGYAKQNKQCVYNIDYMEETNTILSAGAGAMSKFVNNDNNSISRDCNAKGIKEYLEKFDGAI